MSAFTLAAAQLGVFAPARFEDFADAIARFVKEAAAEGARLLVLPEYASMICAASFPEDARGDLRASLEAMQGLRDDYLGLHVGLAREADVYLLAGSFPLTLEDGRTVNRAYLCGPSGRVGHQDKQVMTRFERERWGIARGEGLRVFETELGVLGVDICYDVEFPLLARAQVEAGATLLLAPSCTDTWAGYHRVRVGCAARALENQCIVAQAPLVGEAPWSPAIDLSHGRAGVFGPPDLGFPDEGVLAMGEPDLPGWVYARVDPEAIARVRDEGQVYNHRHWPEQGACALPEVTRVVV